VRQSANITHALQYAWSRRTGHGIRTSGLQQITAEAITTPFSDVHERLAVLSELTRLKCLNTQHPKSRRVIGCSL